MPTFMANDSDGNVSKENQKTNNKTVHKKIKKLNVMKEKQMI